MVFIEIQTNSRSILTFETQTCKGLPKPSTKHFFILITGIQDIVLKCLFTYLVFSLTFIIAVSGDAWHTTCSDILNQAHDITRSKRVYTQTHQTPRKIIFYSYVKEPNKTCLKCCITEPENQPKHWRAQRRFNANFQGL